MKPSPAVPAVPDGLRDAVNALLHQIEIGDFVDSNGHSAKMLKPVHDLMRLISESAAPAVPAAQIGMKASTWETLSPDAQNLILEAGQRAVDKTKARRITDAAAHATMAPIPLDGSAADNAALRADNIRLQNEVVGPLRERVKVLEEALRRVRVDKSFNCLKIEKTQQYIIAALGDTQC